MNDRLAAFARFGLSATERAAFESEFSPVFHTPDLSRTPDVSRVITSQKRVPGIYFWTAVASDSEFKVYAGQTNSLGYRVFNYTAPFQPHSPNDFKLLVFCSFLQDVAPQSTLHLYFRQVSVPELRSEEKRVIAKYGPLLNLPRPATPEAKRQLQAAFAEYYRASFERVLGRAT